MALRKTFFWLSAQASAASIAAPLFLPQARPAARAWLSRCPCLTQCTCQRAAVARAKRRRALAVGAPGLPSAFYAILVPPAKYPFCSPRGSMVRERNCSALGGGIGGGTLGFGGEDLGGGEGSGSTAAALPRRPLRRRRLPPGAAARRHRADAGAKERQAGPLAPLAAAPPLAPRLRRLRRLRRRRHFRRAPPRPPAPFAKKRVPEEGIEPCRQH